MKYLLSILFFIITFSLSAQEAVSVAGFKGLTGKHVELDDGEFEVTLIKGPNNPLELNEIVGYLTGLITETPMVYRFKTSHIRIRSRSSVRWTMDGESGGDHWSVEIKNHHRKLNLLAPKE